jgi:hypothetical protein
MSDETLGANAPTRTYQAAANTTTCTKNVNARCENEATEILWVRERGPLWDGDWQSHPRCAEHPAADDVAMISRMHHWAETKVVPVGAPAPSPDREDPR